MLENYAEFGGLGFDMPKDFPRTEMRRDFIRHYLAQVLFVEDPEDVDADIVRGFEVHNAICVAILLPATCSESIYLVATIIPSNLFLCAMLCILC